MKLAFLIAYLFIVSLQAEARSIDFDIQFFKSSRDQAEIKAAQDLKDRVLKVLPSSMKNQFKKPIDVLWQKEKKNKGNHVIAELRNGQIFLSEKVKTTLLAGPFSNRKTNRSHQTEYNELVASVIHEITHAYDFLNHHSSEESQLIQNCQIEQQEGRSTNTSNICRYYRNMNRTLSQNPYYLQAAGIADDGAASFIYRSPDIYEQKNAEEHLSVNLEYFLLDPEFQCRRPTLDRFFRRYFKHEPFAKATCQGGSQFLSAENSQINESERNNLASLNSIQSIDLKRVYQIHYLLAGEGDAMMSGWGHSMFRIVICSPKRKELGPDCMKDLSHHLVLSFRAFIDSLQIDTVKGLTGAYPSRLFFIPLNQVIEEYNRNELRDLWSYPLKLNRNQIEHFITRALETHWGYESRYYFISNNCAVESLQLLKSILFNQDLIEAQVKTPFGVRDVLQKVSLIDSLKKENRKELIKNGYLFDSYEGRFQKAFDQISKAVSVPSPRIKDFFKLSALERQQIYKKLDGLSEKKKRLASASAYILETAAHRRFVSQVKALAHKRMLETAKNKSSNKSSLGSGALKDLSDRLIQVSDRFSRPSSWLDGVSGYGLPQSEELSHVSKFANKYLTENSDIKNEIEKSVDLVLSHQDRQEFEVIKSNALHIQEILKAKVSL